MKEQVQKGILEPIPQQPTGEVIHYIPHHPVIREEAESTKIRIVYDCSAKSKPDEPSLNDCLETGAALQPLLFDILMRNRMEKLCVMGDIEKAFHQIRMREEDRDAQRVLWYNNVEEKKIFEYRFTRVIFGAGPSPYILGATLHKHLSKNIKNVFQIRLQHFWKTRMSTIFRTGEMMSKHLKGSKRKPLRLCKTEDSHYTSGTVTY